MTPHLDRALLLFDQSRHDLAERELGQALAADPNEPLPHALLALCLVKREELEGAARAADEAVRLAPDLPFAHYARSVVLHERNRFAEAEAAAREAIRLDPDSPDYHAALASVLIQRRDWAGALAAAEQGLHLDPEHVGANNFRAIALVKLGRKTEAGQTIERTLARDPEDAVSHANRGWTLLEESNPAKALEHFREALRLEPDLEWARAGIVEALKAHNFLYRWMLRYFLWMSRLSGGVQWAIILGGFFGYRYLSRLAARNPDWAGWIWPVIIVYVIFALLTWLAAPLFNLMLRLSKFGRLVLSRDQIVASNWVGLCLLTAAGCLIGWLFSGAFPPLLGALVFGMLMIPLSATFHCDPGWPRVAMGGYTIILAAVGLTAVGLAAAYPFVADPKARQVMAEVFNPLDTLFLIGAILSGFVANALLMVRPTK